MERNGVCNTVVLIQPEKRENSEFSSMTSFRQGRLSDFFNEQAASNQKGRTGVILSTKSVFQPSVVFTIMCFRSENKAVPPFSVPRLLSFRRVSFLCFFFGRIEPSANIFPRQSRSPAAAARRRTSVVGTAPTMCSFILGVCGGGREERRVWVARF